MKRLAYILILPLLGFLTGCGSDASTDAAESDKLFVVATTGMIADVAREIAGDHAEVLALMGPGVDPHLYKSKPSDLKNLQRADLILYNGLHLEGKMAEVLEQLGRTQEVIAVGESVPENLLIQHGAAGSDSYDPHIWFDVALWKQTISPISEALGRLDTMHAEVYATHGAQYAMRLDSLDRWVQDTLGTVPADRRVLVTAHDAFSYFGRAYDVEVRGLQGISTVAEFGIRDVRELVDFLVSQHIKAVFVESSISTKSLDAVVAGCKERGHEITIGGTLYSDAMGEAKGPAGNYEGMVRTNVRTIVSALK